MSTGEMGTKGAPSSPGPEPAFAAAVHQALRDFNRPDRLRLNRLTDSQLVKAELDKSPATIPTEVLRGLLRVHCSMIGQNPKYLRYEQVLQHTYFTPLRRQRAVADALHLSWGSYRRFLRDARAVLTASLWEAECKLNTESPRVQAAQTMRLRTWLLITTTTAVVVLVILGGAAYLHRPRRPEENQAPGLASSTATAAPYEDDMRDVSGTQDLYLVGMEYLRERADPDFQRAIYYFHKSIQADPGNADAWAALAMAYAVWHVYSDNQIPDAHYSDALATANKAVALDPTQPLAHAVLALLHQEHWGWQEAQREYRLALRLDPDNADAQRWYAKYFWLTGNTRRALQHMRAAEVSDPLSNVNRAYLGRALTYAGQFNKAENQLRTGIQESPHFKLNYAFLAETHVALKRFAQALDDTEAARSTTDSQSGDLLLMESGIAEAGLGRTDLAKQVLLTLQKQAPANYVSGVLTARLYWAVGDKARCFAELQRAVREHDDKLVMLAGPDWADVRADTRFAAIRQQMGLPSAGHPVH